MKKVKKKRKKSTQTLLGLQTFGKYGLKTDRAELVFYSVQPTNISVLSDENIDVKEHHLMSLLSMIPELELICLDSCLEHSQKSGHKKAKRKKIKVKIFQNEWVTNN